MRRHEAGSEPPVDARRRAVVATAIGAAVAAVPAAGMPLPSPTLPVRSRFGAIGTYLDGASTHPLPLASVAAGAAMLRARADRAMTPPQRPDVRAKIAALIGAAADDIALVPSTGVAEIMVGNALALGPGRGVVTDALHFDGALAMYRHRADRGMPLSIVRPRRGRIDLADVEAALKPDTVLLAVSEISNFNGHRHDLKAVCDMAHARGVLVFADVIQSVGAVPIDVRASGVDFCAASTYKWLMADLGSAFLYVRKEARDRLRDHPVGWNTIDRIRIVGQTTPFDPPITADEIVDRGGAAGLFETTQQSIVNTMMIGPSIDLLQSLGLDAITRHRDALRLVARREIGGIPGVIPLTPEGMTTSIEAFAVRDAEARFADRLARAGVTVGLYEHRVRVSPSIYNDADDILKLADILRRG